MHLLLAFASAIEARLRLGRCSILDGLQAQLLDMDRAAVLRLRDETLDLQRVLEQHVLWRTCGDCGSVLHPTDPATKAIAADTPMYCDTCDREMRPATHGDSDGTLDENERRVVRPWEYQS